MLPNQEAFVACRLVVFSAQRKIRRPRAERNCEEADADAAVVRSGRPRHAQEQWWDMIGFLWFN